MYFYFPLKINILGQYLIRYILLQNEVNDNFYISDIQLYCHIEYT